MRKITRHHEIAHQSFLENMSLTLSAIILSAFFFFDCIYYHYPGAYTTLKILSGVRCEMTE